MLGIGTESLIFIYAGLSGVVVTTAYYVLVLFRRLLPHKSWVVSLEDFFFWLAVSGYLFHQMYRTTYGSIRWFFILGVVSGALLSCLLCYRLKKIWTNHKKNLEK